MLRGSLRGMARRRASRRDIADMTAFDDAMLGDVGITRAQISGCVDGRIGPRPGPRLVWSRPEAPDRCAPGCCSKAA